MFRPNMHFSILAKCETNDVCIGKKFIIFAKSSQHPHFRENHITLSVFAKIIKFCKKVIFSFCHENCSCLTIMPHFNQSGSFKINIKTPAREYGGSTVEWYQIYPPLFWRDCTFKRESTKKDDLFYTPVGFSLADTLEKNSNLHK